MYDEIQAFVNWLRRRNPQARTWRDYGYDLKQFVAIVGEKPPTKVTIQDVDTFITVQATQGLKASTINRHLAAIISFYTFLSDENPDIDCPVRPHRHNLRTPQRLPRPASLEDLLRFFSVIEDDRDLAMFLLMLRCGLRISEVAKLRVADLYLDEPPPRLRIDGKNRKERTVYLSEQVLCALKTYLAQRPKVASEFVFLSYQNDGLSTTAIHKRLMRYRAAAAIHLTAHQLRHSFVNDLVTAEVPVTTIQKLMGHAWIATTQSYIAANDRKVQKDFYLAAQQLDSWHLVPVLGGM